jgi:hypothetical protein
MDVTPSRPPTAAATQDRLFLERLWRELLALPPWQREVLLLSLRDRDGGSVTALLPVIGVASLREIAQALGMAADAVAAVWNDLPLGDPSIATLLDLRPAQVAGTRAEGLRALARGLRRRPQNPDPQPGG